MPPKHQVYRFTIGPNPRWHPAREVEAIGTFTAYVPADRTLNEFFSDLSDQFPFDTPDSVLTHPQRPLDHDKPVGKLRLDVGQEWVLTGYSNFVMRLDSIALADGDAPPQCAFDLSGFDVDRMHEAVEDYYATADDIDVPVNRVLFLFALQDRASGKALHTSREARLRRDPQLGLLATLAVEQSDGLLDLSTLTLSVGPADEAEGRLSFAGGDFQAWTNTRFHELGIEPNPVGFDGTGGGNGLPDVSGWKVVLRPPESGSVEGHVSATVMSNGEYWKLKGRS